MDKTIVWAVDAFESSGEILDSAVRALRVLAPRLDAQIQPVYVLTPAEINLATEFSETGIGAAVDSYRPAAQNLLRDLLTNFSDLPVLPSKVLTVDSASAQVAIETLSRYAKSLNAEAILVSSHSRHGLERFFLGSFAETLMAHSEIPVVVAHRGTHMSPGNDIDSGANRILIPTDLTELGHANYLDALEAAQKLKIAATLFHVVSYPIEPMVQSGVYLIGGGWMPLYSFMYEEVARRQARLDQWVKEGESRGVNIRGLIYSEGGGIAEAILRVANDEKPNLIAMAVQSGPIAAALLGSVTREVVRKAPCPVWVTRQIAHPHSEEKSKSVA